MATETAVAAATTQTPTRRPYHGSCHCGLTKYIAFITLPPPIISAADLDPRSTTRIRKCNCSTCHKMSFFHVRVMDAPNDFLLLSPLTAEGGIRFEVDGSEGEGGGRGGALRDYTCFEADIHWYFCGVCGVRCFAFMGEGGPREVLIRGEEGGEGEVKRGWMPKPENWKEEDTSYLSINAATLEPGQEGCDLREWTEKGWIVYLDTLNVAEDDRLLKPFVGGMY